MERTPEGREQCGGIFGIAAGLHFESTTEGDAATLLEQKSNNGLRPDLRFHKGQRPSVSEEMVRLRVIKLRRGHQEN